jgi:trk system potassium uptake protein TrkA
VVNKKIMDLVLPKGALFISIIRGEEVIIPSGDTDLREDDQILVLVRKVYEAALREMLLAPATDRRHA